MQAEDPTLPLWAGARPVPLQRGEALGRYLVLEELGRGGMGVVYAAYDPELDRKVAVKLLHPGRAGRNDGGVAQARLLREAKALARLSHPNVIHVYDAGTFGDRVFLAMELVDGEPLDRWLEAEPERPWRQVLAVFQAAGRGLQAAHEAGLVHRDFKPANVLVGRDGRVRVVDFGIARAIGDEEPEPPEPEAEPSPRSRLTTQLTREGVVLGTPRYMAPETIRAQPAGPQSDQFGFCVALFEALYGVPPFGGEKGGAESLAPLLDRITTGKVSEPPPGSRVPAWLRRILLRGLAAEPEARHPSMAALLEDLGRDRDAPVRRRAFAAAALVLVAATALGLGWSQRRQARVCAGARERLAGVWDAHRKAVLHRAFLASGSPYAADAWNGTERALDAYTTAWTAARTEACEATRLRGEQSQKLLDLRMGCLDRRLNEVKALTALFEQGGAAATEKAVQASRSLPNLEDCSAAALTTPALPPDDAGSRRIMDGINVSLAQARALWVIGRYSDGGPAATSAVTAASRLGYFPLLAEALHMRALLEEGQGRSEAAEATLFEALEAAEKGRYEALSTRAWIDLVWIAGFRQRHFPEARRYARLAAANLARLEGGAAGNAELDADLKSNLGGVLDLEGDHRAGLALQTRALALYEKALGPDHPNVGRTLNRIGNAWYQSNRYPEALAAYRRALEQTRRMLGPRHPTVAVRLGNIALVLESLGRYEESLATQQEALEIEEPALGPDHPSVSITHGNLASLLMVMKRPEEALSHARRSLEIETANPEGIPSDLATAQENVAEALLALGRYDEAERYNEQALESFLKEVGPLHEWSGLALSTRGQLLVARGRAREGVAVLRRAIAAFQASGVDTPDSAEAQFALATALWETGGGRAEAMTLARQARETYARTRAPDLPRVEEWLADPP